MDNTRKICEACQILIGLLFSLQLRYTHADIAHGTSINRSMAKENWTEAKLVEDLLDGYNRWARPRRNPQNPVSVSLLMYLFQLNAVDDRQQTMSISAQFLVNWRDDYLHWDPDLYQNITKVRLPAEQIWLPDVALMNSVGNMVDWNWKKMSDVSVRRTGTIQWGLSGEFIVTCTLDVTYFPYDYQTCYAIWSTVQSNSKYLVLNALDQCSANLSVFLMSQNSVWEILEIFATKSVADTFPPSDETYDNVCFGISVRRKPHFYIIFVISPIYILSIMGVMQFLVPPCVGEKVTFGSTVMLTSFVFLDTVGDNIPETSENIPLIVIYLSIVTVICGCMVLSSVIVLILYKTDVKHPVSGKTKTFFLLLTKLCNYRPQTENRVFTSDTKDTNEDKEDTTPAKPVSDTNQPDQKEIKTESVTEIDWKDVAKILDKTFFVFYACTVFTMIVPLMVLWYGQKHPDRVCKQNLQN